MCTTQCTAVLSCVGVCSHWAPEAQCCGVQIVDCDAHECQNAGRGSLTAPPPPTAHTHTHPSLRVRCIVGSCVHEVSVCPPPFSSTPCPAAPMPQWGGAWAICVRILCGDLCCHPPDVPHGPCAAKRREVSRMVRGCVCVCVAEWLELGQAPGYECGCCSMVLCGPAVAVCRVEGPGRVQSAHTSGRPSAGPYSLGVSCRWPRRW